MMLISWEGKINDTHLSRPRLLGHVQRCLHKKWESRRWRKPRLDQPESPQAPITTCVCQRRALAGGLIRPRKPSQHRLWRKMESLNPLVMQEDVPIPSYRILRPGAQLPMLKA